MVINPIIFFYIILSLVLTVASLIILILSYPGILKKLYLTQEENEKLKLRREEETVNVLEKARKKIAEIIVEANFTDGEVKKMFHQELKASSLKQMRVFQQESEAFIEYYKKALGEIKLNTIKRVSNISNDIESTTESELRDFKEIIKKETYASQKALEQKTEEEYKSVQKEIENYRESERLRINDEIYKMIKKVSEIVLGKALPLDEHEQLILEALDKAKQEGILKR